MTDKLLIGAVLALAGISPALEAQTAGPSPQPTAARPVKQYTIEQFMDTTRIGGSSFSHDEQSILFHSNKTESSTFIARRRRAGRPGS
jgi:hypothetical protein